MEKREAEGLYRDFGRAVQGLPTGWRINLLSSHTEFERTFGRTADKKRKLYNGMIKCDLFQYHEKKKKRYLIPFKSQDSEKMHKNEYEFSLLFRNFNVAELAREGYYNT